MKTAYEILKENGQSAVQCLRRRLTASFAILRPKCPTGAEVKPVTFEDDGGKKSILAHLLPCACRGSKASLSEVKLTIGPAIDNGFYYDFDAGDMSFTP